jgi:hypothetical protein
MSEESLIDIEDIKRLKARYFYCVDNKLWDTLSTQVLALDCEWFVPEVQAEPIRGVDNCLKLARNATEHAVTIHHGHMPDIEMTSRTTAKGTWAMEDVIFFPKEHLFQGRYKYLHGFGHYHETYAKSSNGWRIKTLRLTRLHLELS